MAFATAPLSLASNRASAFAGDALHAHPSVRAAPSRRRMPAMMTGKSIDFSKVDIKDIGQNLAGLVFVPEDKAALGAVDTRVNLQYSPVQTEAVNRHINVEYTASYAYHSMWAYFTRDTVALPGFAKFFKEQSSEEREHAEEFMSYQNARGGKVELQPLAVPEMTFNEEDGTSDATYAMDLHLQLEKFVYYKLKELHKIAGDHDDPQMQDFVEGYLTHQVESVKKAGDYVAQLNRVGTPHGVYHFDRVLLHDC